MRTLGKHTWPPVAPYIAPLDGDELQLFYYDFYGRAECIRMMLTHAKVDFEDD